MPSADASVDAALVRASCIATDGVGLAQRASFAWFGGLRFSHVDYDGRNVDECDYLLRQDLTRSPAHRRRCRPASWKLLWEGRRASDRDERFRLFRKSGSATTQGRRRRDRSQRQSRRAVQHAAGTSPGRGDHRADDDARDAEIVEHRSMTVDATTAVPTAASTAAVPPDERPRGAALTRRILAQAWPVLIGQWALLAFGVTDTIIVGHSSPQDLAAMALGASIYASVFVGLMGVVIALTPILGQHYGGQRARGASARTYMQGLWLAVWLTAVGVTAMAFPACVARDECGRHRRHATASRATCMR